MNVNVRNMLVAKERTSEFLEEWKNDSILKDIQTLRIIESGNYYIFTFNIDFPEQRQRLKEIQDEWIKIN